MDNVNILICYTINLSEDSLVVSTFRSFGVSQTITGTLKKLIFE